MIDWPPISGSRSSDSACSSARKKAGTNIAEKCLVIERVFSQCLKDGRKMSGVFSLAKLASGLPCVIVDYSELPVAGKLVRTLSLNPARLRKVQSPHYEYVYDGLLDLTPLNCN